MLKNRGLLILTGLVMLLAAACGGVAGRTELGPAKELTLTYPVPKNYISTGEVLPNVGERYIPVDPASGKTGIGLNLLYFKGEFIGVELWVPSDQPWKPWYDQPKGQPVELKDIPFPVYTQRFFFQKPPTAEEIAK